MPVRWKTRITHGVLEQDEQKVFCAIDSNLLALVFALPQNCVKNPKRKVLDKKPWGYLPVISCFGKDAQNTNVRLLCHYAIGHLH